MPVSSVSAHNVIPLHSTTEVKNGSNLSQVELTDRIRKIENSIAKLNKSINAYKKNLDSDCALLKGLNTIAKKHGQSVTVRLKNDQFKYGEASCFFKNIFHASRYASEREAAARKMEVNDNAVSAGTAISLLQNKIADAASQLSTMHAKFTEYDSKRKQYNGVTSRQPVKVSVDEKQTNEASRKVRRDFSMIYQTNVGCAAINAEARFQFGQATSGGRVSGGDVVSEYRRVHGDDIFSHGNKAVEYTIKARCSDLPELTKTAAEIFFTPSENTITTWRGQGMTQNGIDTLIAQFKSDKETVYQTGQFFSTSKFTRVANEFAMNSQDDVKVKFTVKGNSSHGLSVHNGLSFNNNEGERLYSPLANFKVTAISMSQAKTCTITLEEVPKSRGARLLPR